jgi:hypothetical protein
LICWRCGAEFGCGARNGAARCWCDDVPPIRPSADGTECLCPNCLNHVVLEQRGNQAQSASPASNAAPVEGIDYYIEGSAVVFTAHYHLRRGTCCGNGCRHCPYKGSPDDLFKIVH